MPVVRAACGNSTVILFQALFGLKYHLVSMVISLPVQTVLPPVAPPLGLHLDITCLTERERE